ncbi:MAG: domain S-box-containing protein [Frankiales bacterium]|nr:domain S-box-containing protein [Frankiales bacterium]
MPTDLRERGADGGAVLVHEGGRVRLLTGAGLGPDVQRIYGDLPLDSPLPAVVVARTGQPLVLRDRQQGPPSTLRSWRRST